VHAEQFLDVSPRLAADLLELRPAFADDDAFLRVALDIDRAIDLRLGGSLSSHRSVTTAVTYGISSPVEARIFSRTISATIVRIGWSVISSSPNIGSPSGRCLAICERRLSTRRP
jgi:hypothetical protein